MNIREWALPVYTILLELATGSLLILWIVRTVASRKFGRDQFDRILMNPLSVVLVTIITSMVAAHTHLSRPYLSFLAVRNLGSSWLSREILSNILFFIFTVWVWWLIYKKSDKWALKTLLGWAAILFGILTVYCMAHIYRLPTQSYWDTPNTTISFYLTAILLGLMAMVSLLVMDLQYSNILDPDKATLQTAVLQYTLVAFVVGALVVAVLIIVEFEVQLLILSNNPQKTAQVSLQLITQLYPVLLLLRFGLVIVGVLGLLLAVFWQRRTRRSIKELFVPAYVTCLLVMIGEILGRFIFYATHVRTGI